MADDPKHKPRGWSQSDRTELDEFLAERRFQDLLRARRKRVIDGVKGWAGWITVIAAALTIVGNGAISIWKHFTAFLGR